MSRVPIGESGATTERVAFYPDFKDTGAHRAEFEVAVQAAMTTASVMMQWKAATPAP